MLLKTSKSSHKDNNQNIIYIALGLMGLTVADTSLNPDVNKKLIFYCCLILIVICFLGLYFFSRQAHRYHEFHIRKQKFLLEKLSEEEFQKKEIKPIILDEIKKRLKERDNWTSEKIEKDIIKENGIYLIKIFKDYQWTFRKEIRKIKLKTLTENFDYEHFPTIRKWIDFIFVDYGRKILLVLWIILFVIANLNLIK
jgi:hypothetical protein